MSRRIPLLAITLAVVAAAMLVIAMRRTPAPTPASSPVAAPVALPRPAGQVTLTGTVRDAEAHPVAGVEVVFRAAAGDAIATTRTDGTYSITLAAGSYRVAARGDRVLSIALADRPRLPQLPSREVAGVPDEALMSRLDATTDQDGVDLEVVASWRITGRVLDPDGQPVAGAVVRADPEAPQSAGRVLLPSLRPVLGTDTAVSGPDGRFELRVAPGAYTFAAAHEKFAGVRDTDQESVGGALEHTIFLAPGCIITGTILDASGQPGPDGAIEQQTGFTERDFDPAGQIEPDGTFRWTTTATGDVTLRAWPWRSPPSPPQTFSCRDGMRFSDVVFQLPTTTADLEGVLVDAGGQPVPFAHLDVTPLDLGGIGQQERADAEGRWGVFRMPRGRYLIRAHAEGLGVVDELVVAPSHGVKLALGGTGRLEGTTSLLESGTFTLSRVTCQETSRGTIGRSLERRLVVVRGGRFVIDDLPACTLVAIASWRDQHVELTVAIPANGTASIELALGRPRSR